MNYRHKQGKALFRHKLAAVAERVATAFARSGLSQSAVSRAMGWSKGLGCMIANGKRPLRIHDAHKFSVVTGCDLLWLLKGDAWDGQG